MCTTTISTLSTFPWWRSKSYGPSGARTSPWLALSRKRLPKVEFSQQEAKDLKQLAKKGVAADTTIKDLQRDLKSARRDAQIWKQRYEELKEQAKDFLVAIRKAPERVMSFISNVLHAEQAQPPKMQRQRESVVER